MKRVIGYTLAEVLITLIIIGVIAALTMPNLIHKHHQKELEVRLQKAYAITANTLSLIVAEAGTDLASQYSVSDEKKAEFVKLSLKFTLPGGHWNINFQNELMFSILEQRG